MAKCLMVDVDGVLVNGRPMDGRPRTDGLQSDLGVDPAQLCDAFFAPFWQQIVIGKTAIETALSTALGAIGSDVKVDQLLAYWFEMDSRLEKELLNFIEIMRMRIDAVYLATNQEKRRVEYLMDTLGLVGHVDGIVYSAKIGAKKPDQAFFAKATEITGYRASEHLLIDDTPQNVAAAIAFGWEAVLWGGKTNLSGLKHRCLARN